MILCVLSWLKLRGVQPLAPKQVGLHLLFTGPQPILCTDEKGIYCVLKCSADLPPEAHLHAAVLTFSHGTPACWRKPQWSTLRKGGSSQEPSSARFVVALDALSRTWNVSVKDGVSPLAFGIRLQRQTEHGAPEGLRCDKERWLLARQDSKSRLCH